MRFALSGWKQAFRKNLPETVYVSSAFKSRAVPKSRQRAVKPAIIITGGPGQKMPGFLKAATDRQRKPRKQPSVNPVRNRDLDDRREAKQKQCQLSALDSITSRPSFSAWESSRRWSIGPISSYFFNRIMAQPTSAISFPVKTSPGSRPVSS